jgi:hypothetical protein
MCRICCNRRPRKSGNGWSVVQPSMSAAA